MDNNIQAAINPAKLLAVYEDLVTRSEISVQVKLDCNAFSIFMLFVPLSLF